MASLGISLPVIFITGHGDVPMLVRAMKNGAIAFSTKPFDDQALLDAILERIDSGLCQLLDRGRLQPRIGKAHMPKLTQPDVPTTAIVLNAHEPAFPPEGEIGSSSPSPPE
jgi:FixJ family two-component response regulator